MEKGLEEFVEELLNGNEFDGKLDNITSINEVYEIAKENGYNFSKEELEDSEVSDDILDSVAGGKKYKRHKTHKFNKTKKRRSLGL